MAVFKRMLPTAVAIAVGIFVLAAAFTSYPLLDAIGTYFVDTAVIIAAFALFLGLANVLRVHARQVRDRRPGSVFSVVLIAAMLLVLVIGLPAFPDRPSGPSQPIIRWIFENVQAPIQATFSALLVFFVVTATVRALRVRSAESAVMLIILLLVLVGQALMGLVPILPEVKNWILDVLALAGIRGILLGVSLGALLTGVRLLLGVERPYSD